ncbi:hypothetical protein HAP94_18715 [Acidithiobacillus ferrivorans]|nr:hypothetical protein [Acidithiobacillus ferrivorans]
MKLHTILLSSALTIGCVFGQAEAGVLDSVRCSIDGVFSPGYKYRHQQQCLSKQQRHQERQQYRWIRYGKFIEKDGSCARKLGAAFIARYGVPDSEDVTDLGNICYYKRQDVLLTHSKDACIAHKALIAIDSSTAIALAAVLLSDNYFASIQKWNRTVRCHTFLCGKSARWVNMGKGTIRYIYSKIGIKQRCRVQMQQRVMAYIASKQ